VTHDAAAHIPSPRRNGVRREAVRAAPFHDWVGEAMLQENIAFGRRLEALAGLDGNHWLAVGISIEPACGASAFDEVFIDAVDLHSVGISQRDSAFHDLAALANQFGALPVTRIRLHGISLRALLGYMTRGHLRLQATGVTAADLNVVAHRTHDASVSPPAVGR
jgi:hypothetical protein